MKTSLLLILSTVLALTSHGQDNKIVEILQQFSSDSLNMEIRRLSGEVPVTINGSQVVIESRLYNQAGNSQAYEYAKQRFAAYSLEAQSQAFSTYGVNLFGIKLGTIFPERVCIIGAHYDDMPTGTTAPGADDNASGSAAVLEAARLLSGYDFPNTIIFALWDEEELGLIGSNAYVANGVHGDSLLGYINLDMIGWDGDGDRVTQVHVRPVSNSLALASTIQECNTLYGINLQLEILNPGSVNTDHYSFWQGGYTAAGINEEYQSDFNPHYHSVNDQYQYLHLDYLNDNARLAISTFATLALDKNPDHSPKDIAAAALLFPNPVNDVLTIQFREAMVSEFEIAVTDYQGRDVLTATESKTDQVSVPMDALASGYYLLTIHSPEFKYTFPITKY